ncbi:MAG: hypothetical protein RLZ26_1835 [Pseudomonadota bacterium]|jgi:TRAP-type C4-dicarboxylate transport system substrate-binding protein
MKTLHILALAGSLALGAPASMADTIRATSGFGPKHPIAVSIYPEIDARLKEFTGGAWGLRDTPAGLVAPNEMSAALRDGVTEFGALLMPYFPAEFPDAALPSELSVLGRNNLVVSAAVTEYLVTCADCQAEFSRNGQVFLGSDATPSYNFLTLEPIRSVADMKGKRIRTGAPLFAGFVASIGGEAAQIPSSELFESLSQRVISGTFSGSHEIIANRLGDIVKYVTEVKLGVFNGAASATASRTLWDRMTGEERAALARATQYGISRGLNGFIADEAAAKKVAGIEFIAMDASLEAARSEYIAGHLAKVADILAKRGVKDAQAKIDRYTALIAKWEGLIKDDMSADDLAELRYAEIFAKVDLGAYGK